MHFELEDLRVVETLDHKEGDMNVEPVREYLDDVDLEIFCKVTAR